MKQEVETVEIVNAEELKAYIDGTKLEGTNSFEDVIAEIVNRANRSFEIVKEYGTQIECVKGWDKVHVFSYDHKIGKRLYMTYEGTLK